MNPVAYARALDTASAVAATTANPRAQYIAGGTNIVDLMKDDVEQPHVLVDISRLPLREVAESAAEIRLGALATMAEVADAPAVRREFPVVSQALLQSASAQLRNMATMGGNVLQRTRCAYFRDVTQACNKRHPGTGCAAIEGENRLHAVIGTSAHCICSHPSDLAVALLSTDARVHALGAGGRRSFPLAQLYVLPGAHPNVETTLRPGELIEAISLPKSAHARRSAYLKVRDRASFEFALLSVAVALEVEDGTIRAARVALGGVAPVPWRAHDAERALVGEPAHEATFARAGDAAAAGMRGYGKNDFKLPLTRAAVAQALRMVGAA